jgi:hypothetical protein
LIERLRAELHEATQQIAQLQSAVAEAGDAAVQIAHYEELLARQQATITDQEQTIENLVADNALLKRAMFGSRRERFVDDANHPYDCFAYTSDRRSIRAESLLGGFQGYLTADAYVAYERIGQLWPGVFKASCWVHARRKFEACHYLGATVATCTALAYFRKLFDIENLYCQNSNEERLAARREKSQPIVEEFHEWLWAERMRQIPKMKMAGAINYMLNRWESFTRFLESGAVPMDNNAAERALKYPILGRKAWLFFGNQSAGETAAKLFTLTKTCNRHRIDPLAYLQDIYARLPTTPPDELSSLLPDRWIADHPEHLIQQRVYEALDRAQRARERRAERRRAA